MSFQGVILKGQGLSLFSWHCIKYITHQVTQMSHLRSPNLRYNQIHIYIINKLTEVLWWLCRHLVLACLETVDLSDSHLILSKNNILLQLFSQFIVVPFILLPLNSRGLILPLSESSKDNRGHTDDTSCFYWFCFCLGHSKYGQKRRKKKKKERMTPLDIPHLTHQEGLVWWLTPTTCLQQVIPFPSTLQQAQVDAVTLSLHPSSSSLVPTPCR